MYSTLEAHDPEVIDETTDFTDIFEGAVLGYLREADKEEITMTFSHAGLFPYAVEFFKARTKSGINPTSMLEKALMGTGPFIPGCSVISSPIWDFMRLHYQEGIDEALEVAGLTQSHKDLSVRDLDRALRHAHRDTEDLFRVKHQNDFFFRLLNNSINVTYPELISETRFEEDYQTGKRTQLPLRFSLSAMDYQRAFAQVLTGSIEASMEMGFPGILRVPSFARRGPNHFDEVPLDYVGEGLQRGTLFVEGNVGDLLGKHSTGGTIIVTGTTGRNTADVSHGVVYYIGGKDEKESTLLSGSSVGSITQAHNCSFYIKGSIFGGISAHDCNINLEGRFYPEKEFYDYLPKEEREDRDKIVQMLEKERCTVSDGNRHVADAYEQMIYSIRQVA